MKQWGRLLVVAVGVIVLAIALFGYYLWHSVRDSIASGQPPPGLLIANSGSVDIKTVHVSYPGGSYTIHGLPHDVGPDTRPIHLSGFTRITLDILYSDGREFHRTVEVHMPQKPQFFQIAIEDGAELYLR